jgi:hypothetical protein
MSLLLLEEYYSDVTIIVYYLFIAIYLMDEKIQENSAKSGNQQEDFLIDSHLHLQYFNNDEIFSIIKSCLSNEIPITTFLTNSTSNEDFDKTIELSKLVNSSLNVPNLVIPGIGFHPW